MRCVYPLVTCGHLCGSAVLGDEINHPGEEDEAAEDDRADDPADAHPASRHDLTGRADALLLPRLIGHALTISVAGAGCEAAPGIELPGWPPRSAREIPRSRAASLGTEAPLRPCALSRDLFFVLARLPAQRQPEEHQADRQLRHRHRIDSRDRQGSGCRRAHSARSRCPESHRSRRPDRRCRRPCRRRACRPRLPVFRLALVRWVVRHVVTLAA